MKKNHKVFLLGSILSVAALAGSIGFAGGQLAQAEKPDVVSQSTSAFTYETGASIRLDMQNTGEKNTTGIRFTANIGDDLRMAVLDENGGYKDGYEVGMVIVPARFFADYNAQKGENGYQDYFEYFKEVKGKDKSVISTTYTAEELVQAGNSADELKVVIANLQNDSYNIAFQSVAYYYDGATYYYSDVSDARTVSYVASAALEDMQDEDGKIGASDTNALVNILTKAAVLKNGWSYSENSIKTVEIAMGKRFDLNKTFGAQIDAEDLTFTVDTDKATITDGVLVGVETGSVVVTATAFNGLFNVEIPVRIQGVPVADAPAELAVLSHTTGKLDSDEVTIASVGEYEGKEGVNSITWSASAGRNYPIRVVGVDKTWADAQGVQSVKMDMWLPEGNGFTVFYYPGNDVKSNVGAATLSMSGDVSKVSDKLLMVDANGDKLNKAPSGQWFTAIFDVSVVGSLAGEVKNLNIVFYGAGNVTAYVANVEFLSVKPTDKVNYTVEHYVQTANGYALKADETQTLSADLGATVSATSKTIEGYLPVVTENTVSSGKVTFDGLTLKMYYNEAVKIANTGNQGYLYPLSGDATFGSGELTVEKQSKAVAGVEGAYKVVSTDTDNNKVVGPMRIVGVDNAYAKNNGYNKIAFWIYMDSADGNNRPYIKLVNAAGATDSATAYLTSQSHMKAAEHYVRIYNVDGVRMASVVAGQWCVVEVNLSNVGSRVAGHPRMHVEIYANASPAYSYYIANAALSTEVFGKTDSPIAVTYNGQAVGAMVSYQGAGNSGLIASDKGMRLTQTTLAGKDCVKVDMLGATKARNSWLQLQGLSSADITSMGITKISFDYYIDGDTNNPLLKMFDAAGGQQIFISTNAQTNTLVKVNGAQGKVASGVWCSVEVTLKNDKMVVGNWSGSAWKGLNFQLGADGGSFYIANVVLS